MRSIALSLALAALFACLLSGCPEGDKPASAAAAAPQIATVDLEHIMTRSRAAEAGRAHLAQARQRLEQGFADLQKAWAKTPAAPRAPDKKKR